MVFNCHSLTTLDLTQLPVSQGEPREESRRLYSASETIMIPAQIDARTEK